MKKYPVFKLLLLCLFALSTQQVGTAQNVAKLFTDANAQVTWLGVDFTQAKVLGEAGTASGETMKEHFDRINNLIINEAEKYDLKKALQKKEVLYDLDPVTAANAGIDADGLTSNSSADKNGLNADKIAALAKGYNSKTKTGYGLIFFVETLDKPNTKGIMWVTFIDMASKKVLLTEKMEGKSGGFGFRNYWAKSVYLVIEQIEKKKFKEWKSKYKK